MNPLNSLVPRRILPGELTIARFTQREKSVDIVLVYEVRASGPTAKNNLREYVSQSFNGDIPFAQSAGWWENCTNKLPLHFNNGIDNGVNNGIVQYTPD
jgi:hypothetical protein